MTAQILQIRDYETAEERQIAIDRIALRIVSEALNERPDFSVFFPDPADDPA